MRFVNLTPHNIVVVSPEGATTTIANSGMVARCATVSTDAGVHAGVPLTRVTYGEVVGLPAPEAGTMYVVSALVRSAVPLRHDVASPGDLVRDGDGNVVGCRGLVTN